MHDRRQALVLGIGAMAAALPGAVRAQANGTFAEDPILQSQGRWKTVYKEIRYRDPRGTLWTVPKDYKSDGASIPRALWSTNGGPWDGAYDAAAIVHDYYCDGMQRSWEATHRVFYDAMISRGVGKGEATKKYWAVYNFGPRWDARYRWTSVLQINKEPRPGFSGMFPDVSWAASEAEWASDSADSAEAVESETAAEAALADEAFITLQQREMERAARQIDERGLGPDDVPALEPDLGT